MSKPTIQSAPTNDAMFLDKVQVAIWSVGKRIVFWLRIIAIAEVANTVRLFLHPK